MPSTELRSRTSTLPCGLVEGKLHISGYRSYVDEVFGVNLCDTIPRALFFKMKPFHSFIFLIPSSITVLAKPFTNENVGPGPDGVKCTLSTVSVKNPKDLLTFNGYCVYSKSHDNCKTGVALLQYYDPQNVCPLGNSYSPRFIYFSLRSSITEKT